MSDFTSKLQQQKRSLEAAKEARSKAEATKEQLEKQRAEQEAQCRGLGVEPENLDTEIAALEESIKANIEEIDSMIPDQFRG